MKNKFSSDKTMSGDSWKEIQSWAKPGGEERMRKYGAKQDLAAMKQRPAPQKGDMGYDAHRSKMLELQSTATGKDYQDLLRKQEYMDEAREQYKNSPSAKGKDFNKWLERQKLQQTRLALIQANNPNRRTSQRLWG